jgi:ABC-type long-subunit fatty acid transport system fused permease/ATPase subunit
MGLILVVFAFVIAVIAVFWTPPSPGRWNTWNLIAAALAFYFASILFSGVSTLLGH